MVKLIKSAVKCYTKKTRKTVGGKKKTYEYKQYLVPLKKSDNLECSEDVFILTQGNLEDMFGISELSQLDGYLRRVQGYQSSIGEYQKQLTELDWKHREITKSYKALLTKHTKSTQKMKAALEMMKNLEGQNQTLAKDLSDKKTEYSVLEDKYKVLKDKYEAEMAKSKNLEDERNVDKNKDIWTALKSRLVKKELKDE
jgi:hypothetical protein